ncbi:MAG: NAD(P)/FAD-dependent oxidoreductase [Candidatus Limnocylindria bacterium]
MTDRADVVVIGAGIIGASVTRELALRGVKVLLVDAAGVARGTTGLGEGNVILADKAPGPELDLAILGQAIYDELAVRYGDAIGLRRKGCLVLHGTEDQLAAGARHAAEMRARGVEADVVGREKLREHEPHVAPDLAGATFFPRDVQVDAAAVTRSLVGEARDAGARFSAPRAVTAIRIVGERVIGLSTDGGDIDTAAVVLAAGAWSAALAATAGLHLPVVPRRGQLVRTEPRPDMVRRKLLDGSYAAGVVSDTGELIVSTVLETASDGGVVVGSSREVRGFDTDPDERVTDAIMQRAERFLPGVRSLRVERVWAGLRPFLPDHLPAIGPSSRVSGLWVATGHEGAGIGLGPATGRVVAQLFCGEPPSVDVAAFAPDRFATS